MRVLMIHQGDYGYGGGQTQMNRLQAGLTKFGVDAKILCRAKTRPDSIKIPKLTRVESCLGSLTGRLGLNDIHCVSSFLIKNTRAFEEADILDFHCIHHGFFSYLALPGLTARKPAVYTLHDMWPFTGHCHTSLDCNRWRTGCGKCPYPEIVPAIQRDATHWEWKLKNWVYKHSNFVLVAPSRWLAEKTKDSILKDFPLHHIPHGIDTEIYQPLDSDQCRSLLGIPPGKKVLAFVVDNLNRHLKGGDLLIEALQGLPDSLKAETVLLLLGQKGDGIGKAVDIPTIHLGYVSGDRFRTICYSAADVFVLPTRADNQPLTVLESMACGTPVVSFRVGGISELVRHGISGYVAEAENTTDLAKGLVQLLEDEPLRNRMSQQSRDIILKEYSLELQAQRYSRLYSQLMQNGPGGK